MLVMMISVIGVGMAYVTHMLLAQWLGVAHYGHYVYALAWLNVLVTLVQVGMNTSTMRLTAELRAKNNHGAVLGLSRFSTLVVLVCGCVIIATIIGAVALTVVYELALFTPTQVQTLAIMLPLVIVLGLLNQRMAILQGFERVAQAHMFLEVVRPVLLIAIMAVLLGVMEFEAPIAMAVNALATMLTLVVASVVVVRLLNSVDRNTGLVPEYHNRTWLAVSLPYLVIGGLTVVMDQSDVLILGTLMGGAAAGLYLPALKLSQLILFPMLAIRSQAAPLLAKLYAENQLSELQRQMNTSTVSSVLFGFVLLVVGIWQREFLLGLFGAEFVEAAPAILVLAFGMATFVITGGIEVFLIFGPFERMLVKIYVLVVVVNIALNLILIPLMGFVGAAYATAATIILRGVLSVYVVWRKTGILPWVPVSHQFDTPRAD